ncbi:MAG: GGDEF domain-containing protein [Desulfobacteraceae bacterium]|jgi:diguanylate cyclase
MQYTESIEKSREYLKRALEMIGKFRLSADPITYSIWYEYTSGKNQELKTAIDQQLECTGTFPQESARHFYQTYITENTAIDDIMVKEGLQKILASLIQSIKVTDQQYAESEEQMGALHQLLAPALSEGDVKIIVAKIRDELESMTSANSAFRHQIDEATHEINRLKEMMTQYQEEALKDPLTRISNRRDFDLRLSEAIGNANADGSELCLIMADIDHFKQVNDTYGHLVGDNVLQVVAGKIGNIIKGKDTVARVGGEEFAILLPETPFVGAIQLADNIRTAFEKLDFKKRSSRDSIGKITLSFGVTQYKYKEPVDDFVNRADKALYKSKNDGRNRVSAF